MTDFTPRQQKRHRFQLAEHLEKNVTDKAYDHNTFYNVKYQKGCALGYAAQMGIAGMTLWQLPTYFDAFPLLQTEETKSCSPRIIAHIVFGEETYYDIFSSLNAFSREEVINKLRTWEPQHV